MVILHSGRQYWIEPLKIAILILAFLALVASIVDGIPAIIVAVLLCILDSILHPFPIFAEVVGEGGDEPTDEDLDGPV